MIKTTSKLLTYFFSKHFNAVASIASILSLLIVVFTQWLSAVVALSAFIVFLVIILFRFIYLFNSITLNKSKDGYFRLATYVNYSTVDGRQKTYELHKYLQCKSIIMEDHIHDFHWTGSTQPQITSLQQNVIGVTKGLQGQYDKVLLKFKNPLLYNDISLVHIKMSMDDSDNTSRPFCGQKVTDRIQLLSFRVELKHLGSYHNAKIMRKKLDTPLDQEYETIDNTEFDQYSRSYNYNLFSPEVGYAYKIDWS